MEDGIKLAELCRELNKVMERVPGVLGVMKRGVLMTTETLHEFCNATTVVEINGEEYEIGIFDSVAFYAEVENG